MFALQIFHCEFIFSCVMKFKENTCAGNCTSIQIDWHLKWLQPFFWQLPLPLETHYRRLGGPPPEWCGLLWRQQDILEVHESLVRLLHTGQQQGIGGLWSLWAFIWEDLHDLDHCDTVTVLCVNLVCSVTIQFCKLLSVLIHSFLMRTVPGRPCTNAFYFCEWTTGLRYASKHKMRWC